MTRTWSLMPMFAAKNLTVIQGNRVIRISPLKKKKKKRQLNGLNLFQTSKIPAKLSLEQASEFYNLDVKCAFTLLLVKTSSIKNRNLLCVRVNNVRWLRQLDFDILWHYFHYDLWLFFKVAIKPLVKFHSISFTASFLGMWTAIMTVI